MGYSGCYRWSHVNRVVPRGDQTTRVSDKKRMPGLAEEPDALAPVTVEVLVVRTQCYRPTILTETGTRT